jgi:sodium transport system permease protein
MHALLTVFRKEFFENLRDRRTLIAALVFGPLFGPALLALSLQLMLERGQRDFDTSFRIAVSHVERAPNLVEFLRQQNLEIRAVAYDETEARAAVTEKREKLVLAIPEDFGSRLAAAEPAPVVLYADDSDMFNGRYADRLARLLQAYNAGLAQMRLAARGVDPLIAAPVAVQEVDVSTPRSRAVLALGVMSYLVIFAMLMGGMYLAIDATAGERERGSLEALLTTPVPRSRIIYGKILAACAYMFISLVLTVTACAVVVQFVRLEDFGMTANLGLDTAPWIVAVCMPLIPAGAALMTVIASFTRSYREAQSWLGFAMMVPTLPLAFIGLLGLQPSATLMAVPSLSQHFLITSLLRDEPLVAAHVALSAGASLALGLLLAFVAGRLYERESILG